MTALPRTTATTTKTATTIKSTAAPRPIERVLAALGVNALGADAGQFTRHPTGSTNSRSLKVRCPCHDDEQASLSIGEGVNGIVLLHCHAGCSTKKIVETLGLTFADLNPADLNPAGQRQPRRTSRTLVAQYDYTDADGNLLYQVLRFAPKEFRQRRPGPNGEWLWNLQGVPRVLYGLPRLLAAPAAQWVFVVEGEKDTVNLRDVGLVATTNAQGAGKWEPHFNQWLAGRRLCILPDNDDAGRRHAHAIAAQVQQVAACVRVLELPGLPPKGDVSDWLALGHSAVELVALAAAAADYTASLAPSAPLDLDGSRAAHEVAHDFELAAMLTDHPTHDHGNAEVVNTLYAGRFAYCPELGWMRRVRRQGGTLEGTHWETSNAEFEVNRAITATLIRRRMAAVEAEREDVVKSTVPNESRKNAVKGMVRDLVALKLADFDRDPHVLNCANGVVDLRRGTLVAHGPSDRFTYCLPVAYSPGADQSAWLQFLAGSVGDYEHIALWLQMAFGYSITGLTREECLFYVHGPTRSGKGTFTQAALTLLGSPLARGVDFSTFTRRRDGDSQNFDLAPLRPARFISASESGRYSSLNEAVVKNITGNDPITAAFKHRDPFTYTPQFKIWLSSNHPVKGDVDDDAFWGRLRVLRFPHSHLGQEDKQLKWRMSSPDVLPGILAWAVEGAWLWYESSQGLVTPYEVDHATKQQRAELDHVQQWLDECTTTKNDESVTMPNLRESYETWCEENGHVAKKAVAFGRALKAKGFESCQKRIGESSYRAYRGLILRASL